VKVRGLVTFLSPEGWLVVQDDTGPVHVRGRMRFVTTNAPPGISNTLLQPVFTGLGYRAFRCLDRRSQLLVQPGDRVEVAGLPGGEPGELLAPELIHAELRRLGQDTPPAPRNISANEAMSGRYDASLVRLKARVVDRETHAVGKLFQHTVWLQAGGTVFEGLLVSEESAPLDFARDTLLEATGLCAVKVGEMRQARSFSLHLADRSALQVVQGPAPWLSPAVWKVGAGAGGVLGLFLGWVWLLRRQVASRTSDLRTSNQRLRASEERFSKAFKNSPGSLAILSYPDARYLDVNDGFTEVFGWPREEVLGQTSLELGLWPEAAARDRLYEQFRAAGSYHNEETQLRTQSGAIITVVQSGELIEIGGRSCILVTAVDITARKQAEAELLKSLERERELGDLKTNFVSMVSHEFRTPLEIILSSAEILDRYLDRLPPEQRAKHLQSIQGSVKRMAAMMEEVLLLGRFESGRLHFKPDDLLLSAWCRRLVDEMQAATNHVCPVELVAGSFPPLVRTDESLLRHILTNLLSNAIKYSAPGSPVRFAVERDGRDAVFRVTDRGMGIPAGDQGRLFETFHRGRNAGQVAGTGLGLVIVKRCVELHGGRVEFASEEGKGTEFTVWLPIFEQPATKTDPASQV
jgi:PAS domain S-box-containing protein